MTLRMCGSVPSVIYGAMRIKPSKGASMRSIGRSCCLVGSTFLLLIMTAFAGQARAADPPIFNAIEEDSVEKVTALIHDGANVNVNLQNMITPLHLASSTPQDHAAEIVALLIKAGAEVNAVVNFKGGPPATPLALAKGGRDYLEGSASKFMKVGADGKLAPVPLSEEQKREVANFKAIIEILLANHAHD